MHFIAQALHIVKHRIARFEHERRFSGHMEVLAARIPVRPLGNAHHGQAFQPQFSQNTAHRAELARTTVDQKQVRALGRFLRCLVTFIAQHPGKAAGEHFAHHGEIVIAGILGADIEFAILVFDEAFRPGHHHAAHRMGTLDVRIVVNLNALRQLLQPECALHAF